ncbi:hypothetical protein K491DRAFT_677595 [Lophiostoma macrostomum CBS 122681]|uniref:Uncharacterized protein n=1 Tax=Lophiostoma macrostomum CBS 122681 TaxID=1314788 RepID=A0A6A6TE90_9PLEO|nr:hypothetical protein K491DRAFT_677595 [Lophiostoma macrostomum CBS 122681]
MAANPTDEVKVYMGLGDKTLFLVTLDALALGQYLTAPVNILRVQDTAQHPEMAPMPLRLRIRHPVSDQASPRLHFVGSFSSLYYAQLRAPDMEINSFNKGLARLVQRFNMVLQKNVQVGRPHQPFLREGPAISGGSVGRIGLLYQFFNLVYREALAVLITFDTYNTQYDVPLWYPTQVSIVTRFTVNRGVLADALPRPQRAPTMIPRSVLLAASAAARARDGATTSSAAAPAPSPPAPSAPPTTTPAPPMSAANARRAALQTIIAEAWQGRDEAVDAAGRAYDRGDHVEQGLQLGLSCDFAELTREAAEVLRECGY